MVLNKRDLQKAFSPRKSVNKKRDIKKSSTVKVIIRVRPENAKEKGENARRIVNIVDEKLLIFDPKVEEEEFFYQGCKQSFRDIAKKQNKEIKFVFDKVFDSSATNDDVFESSSKDVVKSLLDGYNCSVFVYGATGAGKTHTMLGNIETPGIMCLTMLELYDQIKVLEDAKDFDVRISYLEIYNETVRDLLHPVGTLQLRDDGKNGIHVAGLRIQRINNFNELFSLLEHGNKNRTQHPTDSNSESSRSHAVFQVYVRMVQKANSEIKLVKLSMIDLAGSERGSATGCKGMRFTEGANINRSLLALGNCINSLVDGQKHIPYRDSKLTRILKDSLGGNCQTVMIANVSPSSLSYEDTYNTLKYASRAMQIKSIVKKNVLNVELHVTHYVKMVEDLQVENEMLKSKLELLNSTKALVTGEDDKRVSCANLYKENLSKLYQKKIDLRIRILKLIRIKKKLYWKIYSYVKIVKRLKHILTPDELSKAINTFQLKWNQLTRRDKSVTENLTELLQEEKKHQKVIDEFFVEMRSKGLENKLSEDIKQLDLQVKEQELASKMEHYQDFSFLQFREELYTEKIIGQLCQVVKQNHMILKGYNKVTITMANELEESKKMLKTNNTVSWQDIEIQDRQYLQDIVNLSINSVNQDIFADKEDSGAAHLILNSLLSDTVKWNEPILDSGEPEDGDSESSSLNETFIKPTDCVPTCYLSSAAPKLDLQDSREGDSESSSLNETFVKSESDEKPLKCTDVVVKSPFTRNTKISTSQVMNVYQDITVRRPIAPLHHNISSKNNSQPARFADVRNSVQNKNRILPQTKNFKTQLPKFRYKMKASTADQENINRLAGKVQRAFNPAKLC